MEPSELVPVLLAGYGLVLGFPLYLYFAIVRGTGAKQDFWLRSLLALGPLAMFAFYVVPHCTEDPAALLVLASLVMFSFAKTLETLCDTHDASVREKFHQFCLYFAIPSDISFPSDTGSIAAFQGVRMQAMRRLGYAAFECCLLVALLTALHVVDAIGPAIIHPPTLWPHSGYWDLNAYFHSGFIYTLESFASFLCIRIVLNGFLLAGAQLAHGDGILIKDCWGDLTFATSLRQIWSGWNIVVHTAWYRVIYKPLLASNVMDSLFPSSFKAKQVAAMVTTFVFSGCVHEYIIWCRTGAITGSQVVFFAGQALILLVEPDFFQDRRGRPETIGKSPPGDGNNNNAPLAFCWYHQYRG